MKKLISFNLILVLLLLCGCARDRQKSKTKLMLDTVITLTADCNEQTLSEAFSLCESYEKLFSKTQENSDVYRLNEASGYIEVDLKTARLIEDSFQYSKLSGNRFDITVAPVVSLWDFQKGIIPPHSEISGVLEKVGYKKIQIDKNRVFLNGAQIDLGAIAKGYIGDRLLEFFRQENVSSGILDIGRNIVVFGDRTYDIGIVKPFSNDEMAAVLSVRNKSVVTSGIYERSFEKDGKLYHHILDPSTGYPVETDLASATIICDSCVDADALSTVCILVGKERAKEIIESTPDTSAVFIDTSGQISYTEDLTEKDGKIVLR